MKNFFKEVGIIIIASLILFYLFGIGAGEKNYNTTFNNPVTIYGGATIYNYNGNSVPRKNTININEEPKFVYDVLTLNESENKKYKSKFLFTLAVTESDLKKLVYFSKPDNIFCDSPENVNLQPGDKILKNSGDEFFVRKFINQFYVTCSSGEPIFDDKKLFGFSLK